MSFIIEFWEFLKVRKKYWLFPIIIVLALFGTALAKVMFNKLLALSSVVFAVSITYLLRIVAIGWGLFDGENFGGLQWVAALLIICGVYLVTETKKTPK